MTSKNPKLLSKLSKDNILSALKANFHLFVMVNSEKLFNVFHSVSYSCYMHISHVADWKIVCKHAKSDYNPQRRIREASSQGLIIFFRKKNPQKFLISKNHKKLINFLKKLHPLNDKQSIEGE